MSEAMPSEELFRTGMTVMCSLRLMKVFSARVFVVVVSF
jgi:hypothetical protein